MRRLFRRRKSITRAVQLPLPPEQLAEVRRKALEAGTRRGLSQERAEEIADAIVAVGPGRRRAQVRSRVQS